MENWERKFNVDPKGNTEEVKLSEEEKRNRFVATNSQKKGVVRYPDFDRKKRKFIVDNQGGVEIVGDPKKLVF